MKENIINFDFASLYPSSFSTRFGKKILRKNKLKTIFKLSHKTNNK